jgi:D-alanine-D-alanine ligase
MSDLKSKIRVGVIRGGPSGEYDVSLKTGSNVLKSMPEKYHAKDIFIDKEGVWYLDGIAKPAEKIIKNFDVIFNALHGDFGEDGKVQQILDSFSVPYTGSGALASALGMNKYLSKKVFKSCGLKTPHYEMIRRDEKTSSRLFGVYANLQKPLVVKPNTSGSSLGISIIKEWEDFLVAVEKSFRHSDSVLVEEFIEGREATCAVLDSAKKRDEVYALSPIEILKPTENAFFDYDAKYSGKSQEICPGNFTLEQTKQIQDLAVKAHKALGLRHYSRSDFIVTPDEIYILETNTLPGLTSESLLPKALREKDCEFHEFLDHVLTLALRG